MYCVLAKLMIQLTRKNNTHMHENLYSTYDKTNKQKQNLVKICHTQIYIIWCRNTILKNQVQ